jgi:hypothetical protein
MKDHDNLGDETLLAGYGAMARFLTEERGLKTSKSTLSKLGAPSVNAGLPEDERLPIEGYWGILPTVKPSRLLEWAWRRLRPSRSEPPLRIAASAQPAPLVPVPPARASKTAAAPPSQRKRGRPTKVQPSPWPQEARTAVPAPEIAESRRTADKRAGRPRRHQKEAATK